ncbi:IclR family transcriptional regulator [Mycolicibacterium fluoranthenivorans]|uniref:DNA-binding IclR family transcriptional regulator n=1 Tax=Mycolicibacterium fluoranthenivorans TaxID=258505 RepID=A0A7X5ZBH7_9MYCO|nr:IclR family transcriptional regulator C-terminal domain-containing protein [Mycolicibacterium fluoranthenivorans]MCV7356836.1 helix-turn-helix domain-containing protein [Mycolicibacterium fluoranthenivorans]NIH94228.1 DNA-binding IclR family transcriptional regulator [Mycolicibacterium fluoranthenivorans]
MTARRDPSPHHPSTVSNSLEILETVAALGLGVTAKEIATSLHMPPATAYRLLNALVAEEYLVRTADLRGFGLGARLNGLLTTASTPNLCHAARVHLAAVRDEVRFAIHLLVFHPTSVRVLDADPDHPVRAERELVRNLHASAAGHLLLASASTWQRLLPPTALRKLTPHTITSLAELNEALRAVRSAQFAVQSDQLEIGLACAAVPLLDTEGDAAGALCIAGPSARTDTLLTHIDRLRAHARELAPLVF